VAPNSQIATAIWLFGGAYIGIQLPIRAQNQDVWDVPSDLGLDDVPGSWGGHAVYLVGVRLAEFGIRDQGFEVGGNAPKIRR